MASSLKKKTINGMIWSSVQKFGTLIITFITNMVLARLLMPEDFGVIGMLMVFLSIADTFVNGGFASALIQKKEPTHKDYSTVFYWNLVVSILFYIILYVFAPKIAEFYKMPLLESVLRIQGFILFFSAFNIVQTNQLIKTLNFKKLSKINISSTIIGAVVGVLMAYYGYGVWSLVVKMLVAAGIQSLMLWFGSKWRPGLIFSKQSFKSLFSYGSLLLISNLSETIIFNLQSLIIGRVYSAKDLGFYTQAKTLNTIPERTIPQVVDQVMFPVYSSMQDNTEKVASTLKLSMKSLAYITFPIMVLLSLIAEPLITLIYSDRWIESVPYFQAFNFGAMLYALNSNNVNIIKSLGRSDYILQVTILKRIISLVFILVGMRYGVLGVAFAYSLSMYVWFPLNVYYSNKLTNYGFIAQIKDIAPNYIISILVAVLTYYLTISLSFYYVLNMLFISLIYITLYTFSTVLFKIEAYKTYKELLLKYLK